MEAPLQMNITEDEDTWCPAVIAALLEMRDPAVELKSDLEHYTLAQLDALLRAVYRGLEPVKADPKQTTADQKQQDANYQSLLKLHGAIVAVSGVGSISRYLCDRPSTITSTGDKDDA